MPTNSLWRWGQPNGTAESMCHATIQVVAWAACLIAVIGLAVGLYRAF